MGKLSPKLISGMYIEREKQDLLQACNGLTSESVKIPPALPGSLWYSTTLFRFPCLGRCLNIENEGEIKPKISVGELGMCRIFLLFFFFSADNFYLALAVFWKQCIRNNLSLFGTFVLVKLACYLVSWRNAIPTDGQEYRQPGDHVQASVCVLRARSPSQECWNACLSCVSALVAKMMYQPWVKVVAPIWANSSPPRQELLWPCHIWVTIPPGIPVGTPRIPEKQ